MSKPQRARRILRRCAVGILILAVAGAGATWWAHRHLAQLIVASFNRTYPALELTVKGVALSGSGELNLRNVRVRVRRDGSEVLKVPEATISFSWLEMRSHFIRRIEVKSPAFKITDAVFAALPAGGPGGSDDDPWRIGHLAIKGGAGRIDLAALPEARFGFNVEFSDGDAPNQLTITGLSARMRDDGAAVLSIPLLKIRASPEDLRRQRIREVSVDGPEIVLTERLLDAMRAMPSGGSSASSWNVDRIEVTGGRLGVALPGWPLARLKFAASLREKRMIGGTPAELTLSDIHVRARADDVEVLAIPTATLKATLEGLQARRLHEITITEPVVKVSDALLASVATARTVPGGGGPATAENSWTLERLAVRGGRASVDVTGAPLVEFGFGAQAGDDLLPPREPGELQAAVDFTDLAVHARGAALEPFLRIPAIRTKFRIPEVQRERRIAWVQVEQFDFRFNKVFRDLIASGEKPALPAPPDAAPVKPSRPYSIGELALSDGTIHLDDLGLGIPAIDCRVSTVFRNFALAPDAGEAGDELQTIELSRIGLTSPLDPFVTVLSLDTVFIRFTLAGIWRREIEEVAIVNPRLDIGPDLFWYIDRVQKNESTAPAAATPAADSAPAWQVRHFDATSGQLFLALEGHSELALPMPFESHAENLNFRKLGDLRLKLAIDMPEQDYNYPGYELAMKGVAGRVEFSLPPAKGANNVVNTLRMRAIRWKQFAGHDCFLDVTYDEHGIYGNLGGKGYRGVMRGQFNFLLDAGPPWNGWLSGTRMDLKPITDALAPEKFSLTGPVDFRLTVSALANEIRDLAGDFSAKRPGTLRIGKIDDIIKDLPGDWSGVKRGLSRISLETLRDFAYDTAHGDFTFHGRTGALRLDLRGPGGSRKVDVEFHDAPRGPR